MSEFLNFLGDHPIFSFLVLVVILSFILKLFGIGEKNE